MFYLLKRGEITQNYGKCYYLCLLLFMPSLRAALANVSYIQDNGQLVPVATNIELNSKGFYTIQPIPSGGNYQVCLYKEGFEDKNTTIFVDATMDNEIVSKVCNM